MEALTKMVVLSAILDLLCSRDYMERTVDFGWVNCGNQGVSSDVASLRSSLVHSE